VTSNSARSCRPIAAWMFRMTIDFSRERKRPFLCTELSPLPPSQFSIKGTKSAAAYLDPSKSEIRLGRCCRSSGRATKHLMFGSEHFGFIRATRDSRSIKPAAPVSELSDDITIRKLAGEERSYAARPQSITFAIHTAASGSNQMR
jgi:hypothetical protein